MNKQFNLQGINGLYLSYKPQVSLTTINYKDYLMQDFDFFPESDGAAKLYNFKNSQYKDTGKILGSNSTRKANSSLKYSEISVKDALIANKIYYNSFKFYFRFAGSGIENYKLSGLTSVQTKKILDRLRLKLYVYLGVNLISMELTDLEKFDGSSWVAVDSSDVTGSGDIEGAGDYGIQLTTGNNGEDCIDMAFGDITMVKTLFDGYLTAPENYNFRVTASFPDFEQTPKNSKNYKIIVKYFNIGVAGTGGIYSVSEQVELMSDNYSYYEEGIIQAPEEFEILP
jgi:hypothetical protein